MHLGARGPIPPLGWRGLNEWMCPRATCEFHSSWHEKKMDEEFYAISLLITLCTVETDEDDGR